MYQSEQINELAAALSKAQGEILPAIKDSTNPFFKSKYADLGSVWDACKAALSKYGLAVLQTMDYKDNQTVLITTLAHSSGQWMKSILPIMPTKNDAQGIGSAITYMRRYSLAAIVGVTSDEDDDGNAAANRQSTASYVKQATISKAEADELQTLLDECDDSFAANVKEYVKKLGANSFYQLPKESYNPIYKRITSKLAQAGVESE